MELFYREAYFMDKPCITMRNETDWVETVESGWNVIVGTGKFKVKEQVKNFNPTYKQQQIFGDGRASKKICGLIKNTICD
ncbi:UDP-N-acetylglucosamine 2-epimerase [Clostridium sp. UBA1056]|uniref:UDP-N-acetylglucosamine 2-epimerase n=2 Tax=unclassified Clostridium TaxID=2614128 RepID=UPI0032175B83